MDNAFWERRWTSLRSEGPGDGRWLLPRGGDLDLVALLRSLPRPVRRMQEVAGQDGGGCYLQHDVGRDLAKAVRFAEAEAEAGVSGTYFLLPPGSDGAALNYYGEWTGSQVRHADDLVDACRRLVQLGHDLGLLNNALELALLADRPPHDVLREEVEWFASHGLHLVGTSESRSRAARAAGYRNHWLLSRPGGAAAPRQVEGPDGPVTVQPRPADELGLGFDTSWLARHSRVTDARGALGGVVDGQPVSTQDDDGSGVTEALAALDAAPPIDHVVHVLLHPARWTLRAEQRRLTQVVDQQDADAHAIYRVVDADKLERSRTRYRRAEEMIEAAMASGHLRQPTSLLDVGSGAGHWIHYFHGEHDVELSAVTAVDIASAALDYVRERFPDVQLRVGDLADPGLDVGGPYDLVTAMGVLHHVLTERGLQQAMSTLVGCSRQVFVYPVHRPAAERPPELADVKNKHFWSADDYVRAVQAACAADGRTVTVDQQPGARTAVISFDRDEGHVHVHLPGRARRGRPAGGRGVLDNSTGQEP